MTDPIKRGKKAANVLYSIGANTEAKVISDLIAALRAAPTAEQLRGWANHLAGNWTRDAVILELRAAADRMEGK